MPKKGKKKGNFKNFGAKSKSKSNSKSKSTTSIKFTKKEKRERRNIIAEKQENLKLVKSAWSNNNKPKPNTPTIINWPQSEFIYYKIKDGFFPTAQMPMFLDKNGKLFNFKDFVPITRNMEEAKVLYYGWLNKYAM